MKSELVVPLTRLNREDRLLAQRRASEVSQL